MRVKSASDRVGELDRCRPAPPQLVTPDAPHAPTATGAFARDDPEAPDADALEFRLLSYFLIHPDEPITREQLLDAVWGYSVGGTATVTVHVRRLREKIEQDPAHPMLIRTVWGVGYCFSPAGKC